jgi:hypothetical protein
MALGRKAIERLLVRERGTTILEKLESRPGEMGKELCGMSKRTARKPPPDLHRERPTPETLPN